MIETPPPLVPELQATVPAPDHAPLVQQVATLRLENAALSAVNAALPAELRPWVRHPTVERATLKELQGMGDAEAQRRCLPKMEGRRRRAPLQELGR